MSTVTEHPTTFIQAPAVSTSVVVACEHSMTINSNVFRSAMSFALMSDVVNLRRLFSEVVVSNVRCEVRQDAMLGGDDGDVVSAGRIYVAIIPSGKNTDASSGTSPAVVSSVRRKQAFPLSSMRQENQVFSFDLIGFEVDVAQDPRRQQGLIAWIGNSGVRAAVKGQTVQVCSVTWYYTCTCEGVAANW